MYTLFFESTDQFTFPNSHRELGEWISEANANNARDFLQANPDKTFNVTFYGHKCEVSSKLED